MQTVHLLLRSNTDDLPNEFLLLGNRLRKDRRCHPMAASFVGAGDFDHVEGEWLIGGDLDVGVAGAAL